MENAEGRRHRLKTRRYEGALQDLVRLLLETPDAKLDPALIMRRVLSSGVPVQLSRRQGKAWAADLVREYLDQELMAQGYPNRPAIELAKEST